MDAPHHGPGFPQTRRTLVDAMRGDDAQARSVAFSALVEAYWKPVYKYVRLRHGLAREDAEDLTQAFFGSAFERGVLASFDSTRARFRTFLRVALDRLTINRQSAARAWKRGGGATPLSLDFAGAEREVGAREPIADPDAEPFFEREWRRALVESAISRLRDDCERQGRDRRFALFHRLELAGADPAPSYADLAREHGIELHTVTNELAAARREFRRIVIERLRELTTDEEEFRDELRALLGSDSA